MEVLDCIENTEEVVFLSDNQEHIGEQFHGVTVLDRSAMEKHDSFSIIAVHGSAASYQNRLKTIQNLGDDLNWKTIIHPSAVISRFATIGKNVFISAGVSIGPNVIIEDHVIILANSVIHHDSVIGKGSIICGNVLIAGNVIIKNEVYIGAGSTIKNGITIDSESLIGMGSNLLQPVGRAETWFGNPAKRQKK